MIKSRTAARSLRDRKKDNQQASVVGNKDALLDRVAKYERKSVCCNSMQEDNKDPFDNDEVDPVLHEILKASKLKPLGDEAKKYYREGHLLERPFLKQFHQHCLDETVNTCGYNSIAIHEIPVGKLCIVLCCCCC